MTKGALLARIGVWLQVVQLVGLAFTTWWISRAFDVLGTPGTGDPSKLSVAIGEVLYSTAGGFAAGLVGCILLTVSITACRYRAKWIFWFLVTYGVLFTLFGPFFLIYCLIKKDEFLRPVLIAAP